MASYSIQANHVSQQTPVLRKGPISIYASVAVYFVVGENPIAIPGKCALIPAGETRELRLPVKCSKIAVLAVGEAGTVSVIEKSAGTKASCAQ